MLRGLNEKVREVSCFGRLASGALAVLAVLFLLSVSAPRVTAQAIGRSPIGQGATGQSVTTTFGTAPIRTTGLQTFFFLPGLDQTITVPADSTVFISTNGGIQTTNPAATGFSIVDVAIFIDGTVLQNGGSQRIIAANTIGLLGMVANWSMALGTTLTVGQHHVQVAALLPNTPGNTAADVSGGQGSFLQGQLTIAIINK
jgi:hypothetical protein